MYNVYMQFRHVFPTDSPKIPHIFILLYELVVLFTIEILIVIDCIHRQRLLKQFCYERVVVTYSYSLALSLIQNTSTSTVYKEKRECGRNRQKGKKKQITQPK